MRDTAGASREPSSQGICEKDIDLAIVLELKKLLEQNKKIGVYYTRVDDSNPVL